MDDSTLLLNIGTGGKSNINEYVNVLYKSIKKANSTKIVLVISQNEKSKDIANKRYS